MLVDSDYKSEGDQDNYKVLFSIQNLSFNVIELDSVSSREAGELWTSILRVYHHLPYQCETAYD